MSQVFGWESEPFGWVVSIWMACVWHSNMSLCIWMRGSWFGWVLWVLVKWFKCYNEGIWTGREGFEWGEGNSNRELMIWIAYASRVQFSPYNPISTLIQSEYKKNLKHKSCRYFSFLSIALLNHLNMSSEKRVMPKIQRCVKSVQNVHFHLTPLIPIIYCSIWMGLCETEFPGHILDLEATFQKTYREVILLSYHVLAPITICLLLIYIYIECL